MSMAQADDCVIAVDGLENVFFDERWRYYE